VSSRTSPPRSWDIFCNVVDNYGDAAVCWRLARGLAQETHVPVRLWIDDLRPLTSLVPQLDASHAHQTHAGVEICHWTKDADFGEPAEVVIDGFGAGVPELYAKLMAVRDARTHAAAPADAASGASAADGGSGSSQAHAASRSSMAHEVSGPSTADAASGSSATGTASGSSTADTASESIAAGTASGSSTADTSPARSLWIILEYLSAEPWVAEHHALPSPHPSLPIPRYFFFPGFVAGTGGLLRERDLDARRDAFLHQPRKRAAFWREVGFVPPARYAMVVSLFGYENPAGVTELLEAWASGNKPVVVAVPESRISANVASHLGLTGTQLVGKVIRRGQLEVRFLPFLAQDRYDELLWASDWNFVRGEDSFVRAQWAERPFVWHIYPQSENTHLKKLEAFLQAYTHGLAPRVAEPFKALWRAWNGAAPTGTLSYAWPQFALEEIVLAEHARQWAERAKEPGELVRNLIKFAADRPR
jgi:uncharacterized repeat protein (TIGR03837 family)